MGLFSWFGKSSPPDYESLLSRLASEINEAKIDLSEIRLRERRFALLIHLYGLALWSIWAGLWWIGRLPLGLVGIKPDGAEGRALGAAGLLIGPFFIWGLSRLNSLYFARQRRCKEDNLRKLLAEQKKQVDAIKKATNYDATRKLIEEYDVANGQGAGMMTPQQAQGRSASKSRGGTPQKQVTPGKASPAGQSPQTPQGQILGKGGAAVAVGTPKAPGHLIGAGGTPMPNGMTAEQAALLQIQPQPVLPTPEKRWYDRVVDSILGEDPSHATQSKYALVCGECFRHNGLVGDKYQWERMQWICPRCNHLNPAPLARNASISTQLQSNTPVPNTPSHVQPSRSTSIPVSAPSPGTPSHQPRLGGSQGGQLRQRRQLGDVIGNGNGNGTKDGTPRGSRLRQQVFVEEEDGGEEGAGHGDGIGEMEIDENI